MQKALVFILPPIFSLLQGLLLFEYFKPYFLLLFFIYLSLKGIFKRELLIYFSFWESIFYYKPFYFSLIFWIILEVTMNFWKKRLFLIHKSFSFVLVIFFSLLTLFFWNFTSFLNFGIFRKFLFFSSSNLIAFLPFYLFLPKYLEKVEYEEV